MMHAAFLDDPPIPAMSTFLLSPRLLRRVRIQDDLANDIWIGWTHQSISIDAHPRVILSSSYPAPIGSPQGQESDPVRDRREMQCTGRLSAIPYRDLPGLYNSL